MSKTLSVYYVRERGEKEKAIWTRIGAAWPHAKGEGFNLEIEALPINFTGRLVVMPPKADTMEGAA